MLIPIPALSMPTKLLIGVVVGLFIFLMGFRLADNLAEGRAAQLELDLQRQLQAHRDAGQRRVDVLALDLEKERSGRKGRDRIIYKEVQTYGQIVQPDRRCVLDGAWRVLHDAAATGAPAGATGMVAAGAGPITDAAALDTVAINYETCRDWRAQVMGWLRYWGEVVSAPE